MQMTIGRRPIYIPPLYTTKISVLLLFLFYYFTYKWTGIESPKDTAWG